MQIRLKRVFLISLTVLFAPNELLASDSSQDEARIYVVREADGAIRFTNRAPGQGQDAEVFTASGSGGQYYRTSTPIRTRAGERIFRSRAAGESLTSIPTSARSSLRLAPRPSKAYRSGLEGVVRQMGVRGTLYHDLYSEAIDRASSDHDVDPALVRAVIHAESAFNPYAVSPKGARGLMQLMPATAKMLGVRNAFSPESNIWGGTKYLAQLLKRFRSEALAVAAYNAGEVPVNRYNGIPPYSETREYVRRVLSLKKQYTLRSDG